MCTTIYGEVTATGISRQDITLYNGAKHNEGRFPNMKQNFDYNFTPQWLQIFHNTPKIRDKLTSYLASAS